ncbi:MAG: OadG family protein [Candidatus Cryptobacteroides sp.]
MEMGLIMSLVAVSVVFLALAVLAVFYHLLGKAFGRLDRQDETAPKEDEPDEEVAAAIAMAIREHTDIHDRESYVITIKRRN